MMKTEKTMNGFPLMQDGWTLVHEESGRQVFLNDTVRCFLGEKDEILGGRPPHRLGSTGRVWTTRGEFFPSVFGLRYVRVESLTNPVDNSAGA
jgi:hypothetical protein